VTAMINTTVIFLLSHCNVGGVEFRAALDRADSETLRYALMSPHLTLHAARAIALRLRALARADAKQRHSHRCGSASAEARDAATAHHQRGDA